MATISQVSTILDTIAGLKVFNDGEIYERLTRDRTLYHVPFVEIVEDSSDFTEHSSTNRTRNANVNGLVTVLSERDALNTMRESMITAFKDSDLMHLTIGNYRTEGRFLLLSFDVSFFASVAKS